MSFENQMGTEQNLLTAMIAGSTAGIVQTAVTYPFEYMKTVSQIENTKLYPKFEYPDVLKDYFRGCSALCIGNALKASSRFLIFNSFSKFMANESGKTTAPRVVVAGLMTGFVETLWVIPFENIKTTLIQNAIYQQRIENNIQPNIEIIKTINKATKKQQQQQNTSTGARTTKRPTTAATLSPQTANPTIPKNIVSEAQHSALTYYNKNPQSSFTGVIKEIWKTRGFKGFTQGSLITLLRQSMNSMVWFSTYNFLQQFYDPSRSGTFSTIALTAMGLLSSCAVVAVTQPLDVLKTRMQTKDYKIVYRDIMTCSFKTCMEEGFSKMFAGWLPRLVKVSTSGTITILVYDVVQKGVGLAMNEHPFAAN